ncbi:MAG: right-handed parallel beta-helix repeat-containing protein [Paracoccaceae bacterium]
MIRSDAPFPGRAQGGIFSKMFAPLALATGLVIGPDAMAQPISILDLLKSRTETQRTLEEIERDALVAGPVAAYTYWNEALEFMTAGEPDQWSPAQTDRYAEAVISSALALSEAQVADLQSDQDPLAIASYASSLLSTAEGRVWAMLDIASAWFVRGDTIRAMSNLRRAADLSQDIPAIKSRSLALGEIAISALASDDAGLRFGEFVLERIPGEVGRLRTASALAAARLLKAGVQVPEDHDLRADTAETMMSNGQIDIAADAAAMLPFGRGFDTGRRDELLARAARAQTSNGDRLSAMHTALAIAEIDVHGEVAEDIVSAAIAASDHRTARRVALGVADTGSAVKIWSEIGQFLHGKGLDAQAFGALAKVRSFAEESDDPNDLARAASAFAKIGQAASAIDVLGGAQAASSNWASRANAEIARELARVGQVDQAAARLALITDADQVDRASSEIGVQLARNGDVDGALRVAETISTAGLKDRVLRHAVKGLADEAELERARSILEQIDTPAVRLDAEMQILRRNASDHTEIDAQVASVLERFRALAIEQQRQVERSFLRGLVDLQRTEIALDVAKESSDPEKALGIVLDRMARSYPDEVLKLSDTLVSEGNLSPSSADQARAVAALTIADEERLLEALDLVRTFDDARLRVRTFRAIAEAKAQTLDRSNLLIGAETLVTDRASPEISDRPVAISSEYSARRVNEIPLNLPLPPIPDMSLSVSDLRAALPAIAPGNATVALMRYSQYNQKFITEIPKWEELGRRQRKLNPEFIFIESGVFDLQSLKDHLDARLMREGVLIEDDGDYLLRLPILIGPDATLVLQLGDTLKLSQESGSYIVNAGKLHVIDSDVIGWQEATSEPAERSYRDRYDFRPFLITWSDAELHAGGATFVALGYQYDKSYGVSYSAGPTPIVQKSDVEVRRPSGAIVDSTFEQMYYAFYSYEADHVALIGNELRDNVVYGLDPHDRSRWLKIAYNTAYGTAYRHGIIISREVDHSWLVGNVSFRNNGTGIMIDRDSIETLLYANTVLANRQEGITLFESSCVIVAANEITGNERSGIKVRNSWDIGFFGNRIEGNTEAGLEAYVSDLKSSPQHSHRDFPLDPYETVTSFSMQGNVIGDNGIGLKVEGLNSALIGENIWNRQSPHVFSNQLGAVGAAILNARDRRGVGISSSCVQPRPSYACPYLEAGHLSGDGQGILPELDQQSSCTPYPFQNDAASFVPDNNSDQGVRSIGAASQGEAQ